MRAARPQKITFGEMRDMGVRGVLVYYADFQQCSHSVAMNDDHWPDDVRLSDIEPRFVCKACGSRGAEIRPDYNWGKVPAPSMGYNNRAAWQTSAPKPSFSAASFRERP